MSSKTAAHLIAEARARIENLTPAAVAAELAGGAVLLVDIREAEERAQHGGIPGAIPTARGMLEFAADPTSAYYRAASIPAVGSSSTAPTAAAPPSPPTCCGSSATPGWPISTGASGRGRKPVSLSKRHRSDACAHFDFQGHAQSVVSTTSTARVSGRRDRTDKENTT